LRRFSSDDGWCRLLLPDMLFISSGDDDDEE
jgi:hypothetical protein